MSSPYQYPQPAEADVDYGPKHRGGPAVVIGSLLVTALAVALLGPAVWGSNTSEETIMLVIGGVPLAILGLWGWWCAFESKRGARHVPTGRFLLRDDLDFIIPRTVHDVSATAFFRPEGAAQGSAVALLIFLENHTGRRRHVQLKFGGVKALALRSHTVRLSLLGGQAAVYRLPLKVAHVTRAGEVAVNIRVTVKTKGAGRVLPARSGRKYRPAARIALSSYLSLQPSFTLHVTPPTEVALPPPASAEFISLNAVELPEPRFDLLRLVSELPADQPVLSGRSQKMPGHDQSPLEPAAPAPASITKA